MTRQHPLGWPRALHPRRSPCRIDAGKGSRQHRCSVGHADAVESYRSWRDQAHADAEAATMGYAAELESWWRDNPAPTFRRFLLDSRRVA